MVGQTMLIEQITEILHSNKFPRFSIFVGEKGSGRRTVIQQTLKDLGVYQECDLDVEIVRQVVEQSYVQASPIVYVFPDADSMSVAAKNALLKVTEEPPNTAYFIMTVSSVENALQTIRSRANIFYMDSYTPDELVDYYHRHYSGEDADIVRQYCSVPGDVDLLCSYNVSEFSDFVKMVIDNVEKVSGANSFKIGNRLNLGQDGYDLRLFWKAFRAECLSRMESDPLKYIKGINVTSKYLGELKTNGINLQMCFDNWLLALRKAWMD